MGSLIITILLDKNLIPQEVDISKVNLTDVTPPTKKLNVKNGKISNANHFNPPLFKGVGFEFIKALPVNEIGSSNVEYRAFSRFKKSIKNSKKFTFVVSGFQTQAQADIEKANQKIDVLKKDKIITKPFKKSKNLVEYNQKPNIHNAADVSLLSYFGIKFLPIGATLVNEDRQKHYYISSKCCSICVRFKN